MPRLLEILNSAGEFLQKKGSPSPRLDAEVLLANILDMQRIELYANYDRPLDKRELDLYRQAIARRGKLEPVAYIVGHKEFFSRDFVVTSDVLIPRPDTEIIVEKVLGYLKSFNIDAPEILDLCTGSGVLAITLKLEVPNSRVVGTDICEKALKIAKINATKLDANVDFILGDLYGDIDRQFDVIVANPPYIKASEMDTLEPNVRLFEPKLALDGGSDGLDYYKRIIKESSRYLKQAGALFLEIGDDQAAKVAEIGEEAGIFAPAMVVKDLASKNRGIFLKRLK